MSSDAAFVEHCQELLSTLGPVRARRMFGGQGLYLEGLMLALILGDRLFLKTDEAARPAFEAAGSMPFSYDTRTGRRQITSYWAAPDEAMDSPAAMQPWARSALASALRAAASKPAPRPRKPRAAASQKKRPAPARRGAKAPG